MKTQRLLTLALLLSALVIFQNCSTEQNTPDSKNSALNPNNLNISPTTQKQIVHPPINGVDVAFENFQIEPSKSKTITFDSGSSLEIPANAFVDANGKLVTTSVEVKYREFVSAADIIASGIPMKAAHNGISGDMESAGMFELRATSNQEEVFIAEEKDIKVNMATNVGGGNFDFWSFDEAAGKWDNLGQSTPQPNLQKQATKKVLASSPVIVAPNKPIAFDKNKPVLNFDINLEEYPELKEMDGVFWQYSGTGTSPESAKWIFDEEWDYANIEPATTPNEFQLELKKGSKSFKTSVCPSQKGEDFENAMASYNAKMKDYKDNSLSLKQKKEYYQRQRDFIRSVSVGNTGIFNYDILRKNDENILVQANFNFGKEIPASQSKVNVFLISEGGRMVVAFPYSDWSKFGFNPSKENLLVAILPNNKVATFTNDDFEEQKAFLQSADKGKYNFEMTVKSQNVNNVKDLNAIIASNQNLDASDDVSI